MRDAAKVGRPVLSHSGSDTECRLRLHVRTCLAIKLMELRKWLGLKRDVWAKVSGAAMVRILMESKND